MRFGYLTLFVANLDECRVFYQDGLGLKALTHSEAFVRLIGEGGSELGLHTGTPVDHPERIQLHFEVPDVDEAYRELTDRGYEFAHEPRDTPWGYRVAALKDPAGHTVELYTR